MLRVNVALSLQFCSFRWIQFSIYIHILLNVTYLIFYHTTIFYLHVSLVSSISFCSSLLLRTAPMLSGLSAPSCKNKTVSELRKASHYVTQSSLTLVLFWQCSLTLVLCRKLKSSSPVVQEAAAWASVFHVFLATGCSCR